MSWLNCRFSCRLLTVYLSMLQASDLIQPDEGQMNLSGADLRARCDHAGGHIANLIHGCRAGGGRKFTLHRVKRMQSESAPSKGAANNTDPLSRRGHAAPEGEKENGSHFTAARSSAGHAKHQNTFLWKGNSCTWMRVLDFRRSG